MPAKRKNVGSQSWGITYADVGAAIEEYESVNGCTIELGVYYTRLYKSAHYRSWQVVGRAFIHRNTPREICGLAQCDVGGNKGAASMAGAFLRAIIDSCEDLQKRRAQPSSRPEVMRLPGFDE